MDGFSQSSEPMDASHDLAGISAPLGAFFISLQSGRIVSEQPVEAAGSPRRIICVLIPQDARHGLAASLSSCLDAKDLRDIGRYKKRERQLGMAAARVALKASLHDLARQRLPADVALGKTGHGRPVVARPQGFYISISHTEGIDAVALAKGINLGLDVEAANIAPAETMLAAFLPRSEILTLREVGADLRHDRFLKLWTVKEALAKLTGEGLSETVSGCEVPDHDGAFLHAEADGHRCVVYSARIADLTGGRERGRLALAIDARCRDGEDIVRLEFRMALRTAGRTAEDSLNQRIQSAAEMKPAL
ncbi:4'-phosphopantetheinyl transferase [Rhodomicrobium vannielii ATCC 17100]|uniref:4'-phosphopantetheinyl transferase n=1 Tax=Rhodomicrobium vannielii (strain ATCC 17100 / DSM 162 / LMG 4299 / NCIMB 10020 / ATH 3.1.1) TaxID=648757 RepID=E3I2U5_RHOVT|nr:4'-phosphopantetheinyl transferase superfamily protein [Rhodomicrobium vannielii]ADP72540.1 4'-phosphopantetheinyl transferase [Rhodomicrobium vannielii ATCC 17100]